MTTLSLFKPSNLAKDIPAGLVVFLVALPLCLGISLASNAPLAAGIIAGIVGGLVVGVLSGSSTSVTGPAAGLTAVVASQIAELGSFQAFLVAVIVAGALQIVFGILKGGFLASFFPSSVVKGLLAAIGIIIFICGLVPLIGHFIGAAIYTIIAITQSVTIGIAAFIGYVVYVQVENYIITPKIMKRTLNVPGAVTIISALIGTSLLGLVGGLLAVPVAASIILILEEVVFPRAEKS